MSGMVLNPFLHRLCGLLSLKARRCGCSRGFAFWYALWQAGSIVPKGQCIFGFSPPEAVRPAVSTLPDRYGFRRDLQSRPMVQNLF